MPELHWQDIGNHFPLLMQGLMFTLLLSVSAFLSGTIFGTLLGIAREETVKSTPLLRFLGGIATLYIEIMRGIPLILLLIFIHFGVMPIVLPGNNFFVSSLITFFLFESAYIAEIVRGGLRAVTQPEREAAKCLGMTYRQEMAYVVLPLAFSRVMPALISQFISIIKDTSLASIIGVVELTRAGEIIYEQTYHDFEILAFQAVVYFAICYTLSRLGRGLEATSRYRTTNIFASAMPD